MSFDISRSSFRPRMNFLGVVMQQGRVQLDSDWNEWQSEYSRRLQAGTLDTVGRAAYPAATPNAFKITPGTNTAGNTIFIGAGRYYVDGLLAENHGPEAQAVWDTALGELSGAPAFSTASASADYISQPYLPGATFPQGNGPFLAYLDVWQRDVTYLEDPELIDKAINIDTTGRLQTVWQVKLLDLSNLGRTPDCSTDIPAFDALQQPPAARLTNGLVPNASSGPCCLAPNTGYTGQENQLYRVEIHASGAPSAAPAGGYKFPLPSSTPTFKWSRDNASVETSVSAIATVSTSSGSVSQLTVASLGRDQVLGFNVGDWIEITDDAYELNAQPGVNFPPGELFQIATPPSANLITLNGTVSAHFQLTGGQPDPLLHTRIRRWDQSGQIYQTDSSGNLTPWVNLNDAGSTGQIPIPPKGTMLVLENGITVSFDLNPEPTAASPTAFRIGDYWLFTARTADGTIEPLTAAPPLGVHHHYAKLAIVTFPNSAPDCRIQWPPPESGSGCCCTIQLSPSDLTGNSTLQSILDQHANQTRRTTICLDAGTYNLPAPLRLTSAHTNITIEACQPGSAILQALAGNKSGFDDGLIVLDGSSSITFSGIQFRVPASPYSATTFAGLPLSSLAPSVSAMVERLLVSIGIRIVSGTRITVQDCTFSLAATERVEFNERTPVLAAGLFLNGQTEWLTVEGCTFIPGNEKLIVSRNAFSAGIVMASSVSFAAGTTTTIGAKPASPTGVALNTASAPAREAAANPAVKQARISESSIAARTSPVAETPIAAHLIANDGGLQEVGGELQNIFTFGASTPATLASQGGKVLATTLHHAAINGNTFERLTAAALLLGETGTLTVNENTMEACKAGLWVVTPSLTQELLLDPASLTLVGAIVALALPLPQGDTSSITTVPPAPSSTYIYTGANNYTDSTGNQWVPDIAASNVTISGGNLARPTPAPAVSGTPDPRLYQAERWGNSFSYTFNNLPIGFYSITLKFAEIFYTNNQNNKGLRIFDVSINGQQVLTNFDIAADTGEALYADDQTFSNIAPNGAGQIVVQFTGTTAGSDQNAKIDAVELNPLWTGAPFLGAGNESESANFFDQLAQAAWQAYAQVGSALTQIRFDANEISGLSAPGLLLFGDDSLVNGNSGSVMMTGNRLAGTLAVNPDFANFGNSQKIRANLSGIRFNARARVPSVFYDLVTIAFVSRAVITSNLLTSHRSAGGFGNTLFLYDGGIPQPAIAVMSNVFMGNMVVFPDRKLSDSNLDYLMQSFAFLNTIIY